MIRRMSVIAILLSVVLSAAPSFGGDVYIADNTIQGDVDIGRFTSKGEVAFLTGISKFCNTDHGPAPEPYPQIHVWEPGIEQLGRSDVQMDGIWFINLGQHWVKNQLALVLWKIRIPNANQRLASEFEQDLTLSMWVDWNQNDAWDKNEVVIRKNLNIAHLFPYAHDNMSVYYLTAFRVPDVAEMASANWWWWHWNKDIMYFWVRGSIACDDPDVSPDGEQLFGEAEDYRVSYMEITKNKHKK